MYRCTAKHGIPSKVGEKHRRRERMNEVKASRCRHSIVPGSIRYRTASSCADWWHRGESSTSPELWPVLCPATIGSGVLANVKLRLSLTNTKSLAFRLFGPPLMLCPLDTPYPQLLPAFIHRRLSWPPTTGAACPITQWMRECSPGPRLRWCQRETARTPLNVQFLFSRTRGGPCPTVAD